MEKNYWEHSHKWFLCPNYSAFSISHPSEDTSHIQGEGECLWPSVILLTRAFNWDTFLHPTLGVTFRYVICSWVTGKLCLTSAEMCKCLIRFNNYLLERQFCRKISVTEKWKGHKKKPTLQLNHRCPCWINSPVQKYFYKHINNECYIVKNTWMGYITKRLSSSPWNQTQTVFSDFSSIQSEFIC